MKAMDNYHRTQITNNKCTFASKAIHLPIKRVIYEVFLSMDNYMHLFIFCGYDDLAKWLAPCGSTQNSFLRPGKLLKQNQVVTDDQSYLRYTSSNQSNSLAVDPRTLCAVPSGPYSRVDSCRTSTGQSGQHGKGHADYLNLAIRCVRDYFVLYTVFNT